MQPTSFDDVHRNLGATKFLIRRRLPVVGWTLRLTWVDLGIVMVPSLVFWNVLSFMGLAKTPMPFVHLPFEPFGLYGLMIVPAVVISIMHRLHPHTDITRAVASWFAAKQFRAHTLKGDRGWRPGSGRKVYARRLRGAKWTL